MKSLFSWLVLIVSIALLVSGCSSSDDGGSSSSTASQEESLASSVIGELSTSLISASSSRHSRVSSRSTSKTLDQISLTSAQITLVVDAATAAVTAASQDSSADLIQIMPTIIEGTQGKLATVGLSNSSETIKVINVIGNSLVKSISGRSANLPSASADNDSTATETVLSKITSTSVANLDEAG